MKKYYKILIALIPVLFLFTTKFAHAAFFGLFDVSKIAGGILFMIGFIGGIFVYLGGTLTNWALNLNNQIMDSSVIEIGWTISRDIANLGFVLIIIMIAFTTILRIETYQTKKLLTKLIIIALLINFSLVFAGIFLDFSGMLTNFFIDKATGHNPMTLGIKMAYALQVQKLLSVKQDADAINKLIETKVTEKMKETPLFKIQADYMDMTPEQEKDKAADIQKSGLLPIIK